MLLVLVSLFLVAGIVYLYTQKKQTDHEVKGNISLPQTAQITQPALVSNQEPQPAQTKTDSIPNPATKEQSAPIATQCVPPFAFPPAPNGGMTYVNWHFNIPDIHTLAFQIKIDNDPGTRSDLFLQLYDGNVDGSGQYFGLQTTGMVLFSRFGTASPADASVPNGSTLALDGNPNNGEGSTYISVRRNFGSLSAGTYSVRMTRDAYDGTGDWFKYYVTFPNGGEHYVGAIRFPRTDAGVPASFHDGGGTWTEFWDNNGPVLRPVPLWHVRTAVTANGNVVPVNVISSYSAMPNSDVYAEAGGLVNHILGGCTRRTHPAGSLSF